MTDRPLSMTELQTIRAALEAADNYAALLECAGAEGESLAAMVEAVHRALAIVDRRIHAINRRAIKRVAGEDTLDLNQGTWAIEEYDLREARWTTKIASFRTEADANHALSMLARPGLRGQTYRVRRQP